MLAAKKLEFKDPSGKLEYTNTRGYFIVYNEEAKSYTWPNGKVGHRGTASSKIDLLLECRETLDYYWTPKDQLIAFTWHQLDVKKLNEFWKNVENILKLDKHSWFYRTNFDKCIIIKVAPFWLDSDVKRQMFSLLLRCGACFNQGTLDASIASYTLAQSIKPTIDYFLQGNTVSTEPLYSNGLVRTFAGVTQETIARKLVKPT